QHRDAIEVQQEREEDAEDRVEAEKGREAEEDAEGEGGGGALGCVVDMQQGIEPPPDERARQVDHRKWLYPRGHAASPPRPRRTISRSAVHTPMRVSGTPPWRCDARRRP